VRRRDGLDCNDDDPVPEGGSVPARIGYNCHVLLSWKEECEYGRDDRMRGLATVLGVQISLSCGMNDAEPPTVSGTTSTAATETRKAISVVVVGDDVGAIVTVPLGVAAPLVRQMEAYQAFVLHVTSDIAGSGSLPYPGGHHHSIPDRGTAVPWKLLHIVEVLAANSTTIKCACLASDSVLGDELPSE
jgi:hypothetical protein